VHLTDYAFDRAAMTAYEFFWKEFCAYYVELVKPILFGKVGTQEQKETKQKILCIILCNTLRLMHPMAPFITEELFQMLKAKLSGLTGNEKVDPYTQETILALCQPACIVAAYPKVIRPQDIDSHIESTFAFLDEVIRCVRNIRAEMQLPPSTATDLYICAPQGEMQSHLVKDNLGIVQALVRTQTVSFFHEEQKLPFSASAIVGNLKIVIPLPQEFKEKEKVRLVKERDKYIAQQNSLREQLANSSFLEKAPPQLIEKLKNSLNQTEKELNETMSKLEEIAKKL
jgi:valyl-tRNA synthetase